MHASMPALQTSLLYMQGPRADKTPRHRLWISKIRGIGSLLV